MGAALVPCTLASTEETDNTYRGALALRKTSLAFLPGIPIMYADY